MWNVVQVVFIYIVCTDDDLNETGVGKTPIMKGPYSSSISTTHRMQESMLQVPWSATRNNDHLPDPGPRLWCGQAWWILLDDYFAA